jgi:putative ABC transport system permease protein
VIRHLLKLVWHRKRANALIMLEIFASFLIVFVVATAGISLWARWKAPLGYDWHDVWVLGVSSSINPGASSMHTGSVTPDREKTHAQQSAEDVAKVMQELKGYPEIESVAADGMTPYAFRQWGTLLEVNGRKVGVSADYVTDDFAKVMRVNVLRGRWFRDDDEALNYQALVLDADAAKALFGNEDPVGKTIPGARFRDEPTAPKDLRVVGVIAPYRQDGEFTMTKSNMIFFRASRRFPPSPEASQVVIRLKPGTPASFEADLNDRLRPAVSGIKYRVYRMADTRRTALRMMLTPLASLAIIAAFLVLMVALGLTGVLWQTVTRRTREIGLRRAVGASRAGVRHQVLGELAVLVTLAVIVGAIIIAQLPLLGVFAIASPADFAMGIAVALAAIYGITLLCGAYPSWLASTIQPAEALHYD